MLGLGNPPNNHHHTHSQETVQPGLCTLGSAGTVAPMTNRTHLNPTMDDLAALRRKLEARDMSDAGTLYWSGDYRFDTPTPSGLGDLRVEATDCNGTYCGHFYIDQDQYDDFDEFASLCDAWIADTEAPEGTE